MSCSFHAIEEVYKGRVDICVQSVCISPATMLQNFSMESCTLALHINILSWLVFFFFFFAENLAVVRLVLLVCIPSFENAQRIVMSKEL